MGSVPGVQREFAAELWRAAGDGAWVFARLPADVSAEIRDLPRPRAGFGSVRVVATLGGTRWSTSVFPESTGTYVLPVKKAVRAAEQVEPGDVVRMAVETVG
jgi:hypothetical protein